MSMTPKNGPKPEKRVSVVCRAINALRTRAFVGTKTGSASLHELQLEGSEKYDKSILCNGFKLRKCGEAFPSITSTLSLPATGYKTFSPATTFSTYGE